MTTITPLNLCGQFDMPRGAKLLKKKNIALNFTRKERINTWFACIFLHSSLCRHIHGIGMIRNFIKNPLLGQGNPWFAKKVIPIFAP